MKLRRLNYHRPKHGRRFLTLNHENHKPKTTSIASKALKPHFRDGRIHESNEYFKIIEPTHICLHLVVLQKGTVVGTETHTVCEATFQQQ